MSIFCNDGKRFLYHFEKIASIPHGSGNTKEISDYCVAVAKENNLSFIQDASNNVIIFKKAYKGYESHPTVILQGHLDMVCEKDSDAEIDFLKDGLSLEIIDENGCQMISAKKTTLGGDDGVAVCYMLSLLEDETLKAPALECVFTVDEEIGMLGASDMDMSVLDGRMMINLDHGQEDTFLAGCAGGVTASCHLPIKREDRKRDSYCMFSIEIGGLTGGHSGEEIHKQRANSNNLMGRLLFELSKSIEFELVSIEGGLKDNAIPRSTTAIIAVSAEDSMQVENVIQNIESIFIKEYEQTDPLLFVKVSTNGDKCCEDFMSIQKDLSKKAIALLYNLPNGVQRMSTDIEGLVETSLNMGILKTTDNEIIYSFSVRSSVATRKQELKSRLECLMQEFSGYVEFDGEYPAWEYKRDSKLQKLMVEVFEDINGYIPKIETIHAGLECGIFSENLKGLDCVSIGPNMHDIHTPAERLEMESFERCYDYLVTVLERI